MTEIFFGPGDGHTDNRQRREARAKDICMGCVVRLRCLERALVLNEQVGVWGGMGEHERRDFRAWLRNEGYVGEIPEGMELWASLNAYYRNVEHVWWSLA